MDLPSAVIFRLLATTLICKFCLCDRINYFGQACDGLTFQFICPQGYSIYLKSAFYGRNDSAICLEETDKKDDLDLSCSAKRVTEMIRSRCENKETCSVSVGITQFGDPCPGTPKYFKVTFDCVEPSFHRLQCEGNHVFLECPDDTFINPGITVMYGRHDNVTCSNDAVVTSTNCTSEVAQTTVTDLCKMKEKCELHVSSPLLGDPCPDEYKYIEVNYTCSVCINEHNNDTECHIWQTWGECEANQKWMMAYCRKSCTGCEWRTACNNTHDSDDDCEYWASTGECDINPNYMHYYCKRSCNRCGLEESSYVTDISISVTPPSTTPIPYAPVDVITREVACEGHKKTFRCPPRTYLRIYNATFGRTSNTTCRDDDNKDGVENAQCDSLRGVFTKVHQTCTGRIQCIGGAYNDALGDPCPGVYKYLEVYFSCQECRNVHNDSLCDNMTSNGDCDSNADWMHDNCFKSCSGCQYSSCGNVLGEDDTCDYWAMREECVLNPDWMAEHCRESCRKCRAEVPVCDPDCGLFGICIATNTCSCDIGYSGSDCTLFDCTGVNNCTDHGVCVGPDQCHCDEGSIGVDCSEFSCGGVNDCNRHGRCISPDKCLCYPYWSGDTCTECLLEVNLGSSCLPCPHCIHGECTHDNTSTASYIGCYSDSADDPDFPFVAWQNSTTVSSSCMRWCLNYNYSYAATTAGNSCRCGNRYGTYGPSLSCDIKCSNSGTEEICGGMGAYSVWHTKEGYCLCSGPNWTGSRCDRCAPGYVGSDCHLLTNSTSATRKTTAPTTTTTTTATARGSLSTTKAASYVPTSNRRLSTTETSKSVTTDLANMITDREQRTGNNNKQDTSRDSSLITPSYVYTTTQSVQVVSDYDVNISLVLQIPWLPIYNDTTNEETKVMMNWISDKLTKYYQNVVELKVKEVIVKRLRPGSVRVDHVIMTPYAATFAEKKAVQCAIMENLSRNKGVMDPDLKAYPEPELVKNCATDGAYCLNGATPGFDDNGYWTCQCPYQYSGERCENTAKDKAIIIAIITICVVLPLAVLLILCFGIPKYRRKVKGCSRRQSTDNGAVNTTATATSFEFHNLSTDRRKDVGKHLYHDSSSLGELNEAYVE